MKLIQSLICGLTIALLSGCAASHQLRSSRGHPPQGIEAKDLAAAGDYVAGHILAVREIKRATTPRFLIFEPVENQTPYPFDKDIIRAFLVSGLHKHGWEKSCSWRDLSAINRLAAMPGAENLRPQTIF